MSAGRATRLAINDRRSAAAKLRSNAPPVARAALLHNRAYQRFVVATGSPPSASTNAWSRPAIQSRSR